MRKGQTMNEPLQTILAKTTLSEVFVHIGRAGLSIGDAAELALLDNGQIGVFAEVRRRWLGLWPRQVLTLIGLIAPQDSAALTPFLRRGTPLRVRVVALTPEHLASGKPDSATRTEISLSVWGSVPVVPRPASAQASAPEPAKGIDARIGPLPPPLQP